MTPSQALRDFADFLDRERAGDVQNKISPDYNVAVTRALVWAAEKARARADELERR